MYIVSDGYDFPEKVVKDEKTGAPVPFYNGPGLSAKSVRSDYPTIILCESINSKVQEFQMTRNRKAAKS